ncbi:MAG: CaiB/BaiF CoA transferase family protein [Rhodomicrobium sp.]
MQTNETSLPPLAGIRVIEFAGLGPAPYAGMLLADLGADVLRIDRTGATDLFPVQRAPVDRGRRSLLLDLKNPEAVELALRIAGKADALIEGFRPGVMERLGLGPDIALARNPKLIYARMTGWGQEGPLARTAGHDLTYLALTGALEAIGPEDGPPVPPLNLIGDMGGGGAFLVIGILAALLERQRSGLGQVVDAAILDGTVSQLAIVLGLKAGGLWSGSRGQNILDGGAPFYRTYRCLDGEYMAVAALEPKFFAALVQGLGLDAAKLAPQQYDRTQWPRMHREFEAIFATKTRGEWASAFEATDACAVPVLDFDEAALHPHNVGRSTFMEEDGNLQPPPAPRFSRSITSLSGHFAPGEGGEDALREWGVQS